jgi:hypothetical protein
LPIFKSCSGKRFIKPTISGFSTTVSAIPGYGATVSTVSRHGTAVSTVSRHGTTVSTVSRHGTTLPTTAAHLAGSASCLHTRNGTAFEPRKPEFVARRAARPYARRSGRETDLRKRCWGVERIIVWWETLHAPHGILFLHAGYRMGQKHRHNLVGDRSA